MRHFTDYDYALVHLFEDPDKAFAEEYYKFFQESLKMGRRVILDNSIFELGESFQMEKFFDWVYKLNPTEYIIPDVLEDKEGTIKNAVKWFRLVRQKADEGKVLTSHSIGVLQGKSFKELFECHQALSTMVDKIAVSFDYSCYLDGKIVVSEEDAYMRGRQEFVSLLIDKMLYRDLTRKKLHLLGCFLPQEFHYYSSHQKKYIETLDTSNPVVHGLEKIPYGEWGLKGKCRTKLVEYMHLPSSSISDEQKAVIFTNVERFKNLLK